MLMASPRTMAKEMERAVAPDPHHHCIFTLPHELNGLWFNNKAEYANVLFAAASQTLQELLLDPKYCGGRVGLLCALHTWNQSLLPHIHLHVLVTGGGLDEQDGSWRPLVKSCMLPRKVLMIKFRGKFKALLLKSGQSRQDSTATWCHRAELEEFATSPNIGQLESKDSGAVCNGNGGRQVSRQLLERWADW